MNRYTAQHYFKRLLFNRRQPKMHSYLQPLSSPNTPKNIYRLIPKETVLKFFSQE